MIIHLTGPDTYRSRARLHQLRDAFIAKHDPPGLNTVILDGLTATVAEIRAAVGGGLFAPKNFIAISGYEAGTSTCSIDELLAALVLAGKNPDVIAVVQEAIGAVAKKKIGWGKKTAPTGLRLPDAKREEFPLLTPLEAKNWVMKTAQERGGQVAGAVAEQLVVACENDSWRLAMELEKLLLHAGDQAVTANDVRELVVGAVTSDLFALTDAIGTRQRAWALQFLHRELAAGVHPLVLITMIARHLRTLRQVQQAVAEGISPAQVAAVLGLHPFVVRKALEQSTKFSADELARWHHRLVETDYRLKSTPLDAEVMLDLLVVEA